MDIIFYDIGLIMVVATALAFVARLLKQPMIPAYIITGILLGPVFKLITNQEIITTLSEIGIAFLLFIVGMEIDFKRLKDVGLAAMLGGLLEVLVMFILGYFIAAAIGFSPIQAVYIGLIVAFSSTMVVVKLLSDLRELDTLHGRIALGILLVQDVIAIFALSALVTISEFSSFVLFLALLKGLVLLLLVLFSSHFLFPKLFKFAAKSTELLFLAAITVCFLFSLLFSFFGFSIAIGAFAAGIALANLPYSFEIIGRVRSLRDFFAVLFFVALGIQITAGSISQIVWPLVLVLVLVIFVKPLLFMIITAFSGFKRRISFYTGISLAQTSEFSLIIVALGLSMGHVTDSIMATIIVATIFTISLTSYLFKYSAKLFEFFSGSLAWLDKLSKRNQEELEYIPERKLDVLLVGLDRTGYSIFHKLQEMKREFIIVDFNPTIVKRLISQRIPCIYGDIANPEVLDQIKMKNLKLIISTVPDEDVSTFLIKKARHASRDAVILVTAYQVDEALKLYEMGADYVILPHFLGGDHVSLLLEDITTDINKLIRTKLSHIRELHNRHMLGHEHPSHRDHNQKAAI